MKTITVASLNDSNALAKKLAKYLRPGMLVTMKGDLGAGKTTFTKAIGKAIGIHKTINSPTFTILKIYHGDTMPLYHIDAYRLEGISQDLGFDEYFEGDGLCIIEWPDYMDDQLPKERLEIVICRKENGNEEERIFTFQGIGKQYEALVEVLS